MQRDQVKIYCQHDDHFHKGQLIKYFMIKKEKGQLLTRFFCDECYFGKYSSYQQYCSDIEELINGKIFEAFKNTKFDSLQKQEFFNYIRNHSPYLDSDFIQNMIKRLRDETTSLIDDLQNYLLSQIEKYKVETNKWAQKPSLNTYFECEELRRKLLDDQFERSPLKFEQLNQEAEKYVERINNTQGDNIFNVENIIKDQKTFFNLDIFNVSFNELIQQIKKMQEKTFSNYLFSQSSLATPYINQVIQKIAPGDEEKVFKEMKRIYRFSQNESSYQKIQSINELKNNNIDTLTIIQTRNNSIFGAFNCNSQPKNSILFQMNKQQYFQLKSNAKAFQLNLNVDTVSSQWILMFGDGDIIINSTFTGCKSNLGQGFDISGTKILNAQEYLSDSLTFDISDMEIFQVQLPKKQEEPKIKHGFPPPFQPV